MAGARLVSRLTTASRRKKRGLDTSLTPGPVSPPCGECAGVALRETSKPETKTGATEVMFHADMGSLFRFRCVSRNGRMLLSDLLASLPVHPSHRGQHRALFSTLCADSCFRASSIADCRIVDTPTDSRSCSRSLVTTAISLRPRLAAT